MKPLNEIARVMHVMIKIIKVLLSGQLGIQKNKGATLTILSILVWYVSCSKPLPFYPGKNVEGQHAPPSYRRNMVSLLKRSVSDVG